MSFRLGQFKEEEKVRILCGKRRVDRRFQVNHLIPAEGSQRVESNDEDEK